jgi:hypothetical protein
MLVCLLILPCLIWLTVSSPKAWKLSALPLGDAHRLLGAFSWRLIQNKLPPLKGGSPAFSVEEIKDLSGIINQLRHQSNEVSALLWKGLSTAEQDILTTWQPSEPNPKPAQDIILQALNKMVAGPGIFEKERFKGIPLRSETTDLIKQNPTGPNLARLNRLLLEDAYPLDLKEDPTRQLTNIIQTEYERAQSEAGRVSGPETSVGEQKALIEACHQRIEDKARSVLNERQFALFRTVDQEIAQNSETQAGEPAWNRTAPFYRWLIDLYFFIILPFSCVRSCGGLIRDELQADTLGFLATRPVKRATLVVLKYLAQVACLEMAALLEGLLLMGAGALREIPDLGSLTPLFLAAQFLAVPAWSALGLFLGQATKRYLPLAVVYGLVVELGIGDIPTNINTLSLMRHLKALLSHDKALQSIYDWAGTGVFLPVGALLLAAVLFVSLAALLFTFREYHAAGEMQK